MTSPALERRDSRNATVTPSDVQDSVASTVHDIEVKPDDSGPALAMAAVRNMDGQVAELIQIVDQLPAPYRAVAFAEFLRFVLKVQRSPSRPNGALQGGRGSDTAIAD